MFEEFGRCFHFVAHHVVHQLVVERVGEFVGTFGSAKVHIERYAYQKSGAYLAFFGVIAVVGVELHLVECDLCFHCYAFLGGGGSTKKAQTPWAEFVLLVVFQFRRIIQTFC